MPSPEEGGGQDGKMITLGAFEFHGLARHGDRNGPQAIRNMDPEFKRD